MLSFISAGRNSSDGWVCLILAGRCVNYWCNTSLSCYRKPAFEIVGRTLTSWVESTHGRGCKIPYTASQEPACISLLPERII